MEQTMRAILRVLTLCLIAFATDFANAQFQPTPPLPRRLKAAILIRPVTGKDGAG